MGTPEKQAVLSRMKDQIIVFRLHNELFGFEIARVNEITELLPLNTVPRSPAFVSGVINYHGRIVTVLDLSKFFNLEAERSDMLARIIVFVPGEFQIGFLVDSINEITDVAGEAEEVNPMEGENFKNVYIGRVAHLGNDVVNIINSEKLLQDLEEYFKEVNVEY